MNKSQDEFPLMQFEKNNIVLFYPNIPNSAFDEIKNTMESRWIGQGPKVDIFEKLFSDKFSDGNNVLAVGSGTDALHLAYLLAGIKKGDEVIVPVFTCTATNIPLLYIGAQLKFADVDIKTLNIDVNHVKTLITDKTKAIVCVHYGGLPCDLTELNDLAKQYNIPVIEDAAHALGATYKGQSIGSISDFTMFSFQAIKHITTGDGGALTYRNADLHEKAKRLRWFGIDRLAKQGGVWENDIYEIGYKYQMTDIAASIGISSIKDFDAVLLKRQKLLSIYDKRLQGISDINLIGTNFSDRTHAAWLCTVLVEKRKELQKMLRSYNIESAQVHYRNDMYSIFSNFKTLCPNMDQIEDKYLVLPLHTKLDIEQIEYICDLINKGW